MRQSILIVNGSCEHPCWKEDDGTCSLACPNLCHEGLTYGEAIILGRHPEVKEFICAIKK